jgi:hypothetical protein
MGVVRRHEHSVRQVSLANRNDYDEKQTNTEQTSLELRDEYYRDNSMLRLENEINVLGDLAVDKAETYAYTDSLLGPSCLECIDDFLLLSIFRDVFVCEDVDFRYGRNQNVVVKVKVSRRHRRSSRRIPCSSISYKKDTALCRLQSLLLETKGWNEID